MALCKAMLNSAGDHQVIVLLHGGFAGTVESLRKELAPHLGSAQMAVLRAPAGTAAKQPANAWRAQAAVLLRERFIAELEVDAVLVSSMVEGWDDDSVSSAAWLTDSPVVAAVLYDLIPLADPERHLSDPQARAWYLQRLKHLSNCDLLLSISDAANQEAQVLRGKHGPQTVSISSAADPFFTHAHVDVKNGADLRARLGVTRPYLMHTGNIEPRKNFDGLIRAFALLPGKLRERYQLVLVGRYSSHEHFVLQQLAAEVGLQPDQLIVAGHVSDDDLLQLYVGCHLFVFPSLHEGFGLPALEAMSLGVPTIGSNLTSVPEVIGRADATCDPRSAKSISELIARALSDRPFYEDLRRHARVQAARFSWESTAQRAWSALAAAVAKSDPAARSSATARRQLVLEHLARPVANQWPSEAELLDAARCMLDNESQASTLRMHSDTIGSWRFQFGQTVSTDRGGSRMRQALMHSLVSLGHRITECHNNGASHASATIAAEPESSTAGHPKATLIASFSSLSQRLRENDGGVTPLAEIGFGVDHWADIEPADHRRWPGRSFRFLYVSACKPEDGWDVLLAAYANAFDDSDSVSLLIVPLPGAPPDLEQHLAAWRAVRPGHPDLQLIGGEPDDAALKSLHQHCHALVAPSRSEELRLEVAEAMLSGLPVITTAWGGQMDFCNRQNAWLVDFEFRLAPGGEGRIWAEPDVGSLTYAMRSAIAAGPQKRRNKAELGRSVLETHFRWSAVAARTVTAFAGKPADSAAAAPRIGWISTWNTRCGIADYTRQLVAQFRYSACVLSPITTERLREDEPFVRRCWSTGKSANQFDLLSATITELALDTLVLQFNFGFFDHQALATFIDGQLESNRALIMMMHATEEPEDLARADPSWRLSTLVPALARCDRILVHSIRDLNRLKTAGLVDNVALAPLPIWNPSSAVCMERRTDAGTSKPRLLSTFGYCLANKGLPELIEAVSILNQQGHRVRLRLLTAEYPSPESSELAQYLRKRVRDLRLEQSVEVCSSYLPDAQVASLLKESDLIIYAYQRTQESASGAVRQGLATGRPVLVTDVPIFNELGDAVFRVAGTQPDDLAKGIARTLQALDQGSPAARSTAIAAARWRALHEGKHLAARLDGLIRALRQRRASEVRYSFRGTSRMLKQAEGTQVLSTPPLRVGTGDWRVRIAWQSQYAGRQHGLLRLHENVGSEILASTVISSPEPRKAATELHYTLSHGPGAIRVELELKEPENFRLLSLEVERLPRPRIEPTGAPPSEQSVPP